MRAHTIKFKSSTDVLGLGIDAWNKSSFELQAFKLSLKLWVTAAGRAINCSTARHLAPLPNLLPIPIPQVIQRHYERETSSPARCVLLRQSMKGCAKDLRHIPVGAPPPYAFVNRIYGRSLRPIVLACMLSYGIIDSTILIVCVMKLR